MRIARIETSEVIRFIIVISQTQEFSTQTPECLGCKNLRGKNRQLRNKIIDLETKIEKQENRIQQQKGNILDLHAKEWFCRAW